MDFEMIKQLASKEIKGYIKTKPNCILLDVRTNEEWNQIGKPDGEKIGLKTYLLPIEFGEARIFNENFIKEFKNLNISQGQEILIICRSGIRSQLAAELLTKENYTCLNISDGFEGNNNNVGWKKCELPWSVRDLKGINSKVIRGALNRTQFREQSESIFLTSGFMYDSAEQAEAIFKGDEKGFQYTRYANPTIDTFEKRLALIDGSESCFATSSGMAAVFASMMCQLQAGDHIVSATALFGSCREIVKNVITRYGIEVSFVDGKNIESWKKEIKSNTKIFFFETPSNPCLELIDIKAVCDLAKENNIKVIVDNVFASPVLQKPSKFGADIIVYSGTKHIDGQGRTMGGAILCSEQFREEILKPFLRHTGPCISPFNAWVLSKGLETIKLRVIEQSKTTEKVVDFLSSHNKIQSVNYPFMKNHPQYELAKRQQTMGGNVLSYYVKGDKQKAFNFLNNLKMINICNNLGDAKSLVIHPATTTHRLLTDEEKISQNIRSNLVRLSVGLEDFEDIKNDLDQALGTI